MLEYTSLFDFDTTILLLLFDLGFNIGSLDLPTNYTGVWSPDFPFKSSERSVHLEMTCPRTWDRLSDLGYPID